MFYKKQEYSNDLVNVLRLIRTKNIGPRTYFELIKNFGNEKKALEILPEIIKKWGASKDIKICTESEAENEIEKLHKFGAKFISYRDNYYPYMLKKIYDPPPVLSYIGDVNLLSKNIIAVVGARSSSINGQNFAKKISCDIKNKGFVVSSGLAKGIDAAAHLGSLPSTVAVIAGGIDNIYPIENKALYEKIAKEGVITAELPIGTAPLAKNFPQRNRIISGISLAVVVVEASLKSGSIITAKFAQEQSREIFAVPGFPMDPRSMGTNKLIKEGAILLEKIDDIIDNLNFNQIDIFEEEEIIDNKLQEKFNYDSVSDSLRSKIYESLSSYPVSVEEISKNFDIPIKIVNYVILELEIAGKIERNFGNKILKKY